MTLLIVGASARAAAQSALRAGLDPLAHDLFADRDLMAACGSGRAQAVTREAYPLAFEAISAGPDSDAPGPWMYTGALENHPDLIDRMAEARPLWGISGPALRNARDPFAVAEALGRKGLIAPGVRDSPQGLPREGSWLVKPRASAGGRSIRPLTDASEPPRRESIYQARIDGASLSAVFVGRDRTSTLLGVSRQVLGRAGEPFAYAGSLGPWPLGDRARAEVAAIGAALAGAFGLRGLFGVDFVLRGDGRPVAIEVNPRYTASAEVLELASGRSLLAEHRRAFAPEAPAVGSRPRPPRFVGKAILFADRRATLPALDAWGPRALATFAVPTVADVPAAGAEFDAGDPVMTVLARGATLAECESRLARRLARWRGRLLPPPG